MAKATHNGHCQICGRIHAAQRVTINGAFSTKLAHVIALHGYRVADHSFHGDCMGSGQQPLQESRERCDAHIEGLEAYARIEQQLSDEYKSGARLPDMVTSNRKVRNERGEWVNERIPYAGASEWKQREERDRKVRSHKSRAEGARAHAALMRKLADEWHGKDLLPRV